MYPAVGNRTPPGSYPPPPLSMERIQPPPPTMYPGQPGEQHVGPTTYDNKIWSLQVVQQPIRARMCGFGDKVGFVFYLQLAPRHR